MRGKDRALLAVVLVAGLLLAAGYMGYMLLSGQIHKENMGMQVTIVYTDGSTWTIDSQKYPLEATIIDPANQGREVSYIKIELYMTPTFTAPIIGYSVTGTVRCYIIDQVTNNRIYDTSQKPLEPLKPLPTLTSGQAVMITGATITAEQLEQLYSSWVSGRSYQMVWQVDSFSVTLNFADGHSETKAAQNLPLQMQWTFTYKSTEYFQSISVSFNRVIGYK